MIVRFLLYRSPWLKNWGWNFYHSPWICQLSLFPAIFPYLCRPCYNSSVWDSLKSQNLLTYKKSRKICVWARRVTRYNWASTPFPLLIEYLRYPPSPRRKLASAMSNPLQMMVKFEDTRNIWSIQLRPIKNCMLKIFLYTFLKINNFFLLHFNLKSSLF